MPSQVRYGAYAFARDISNMHTRAAHKEVGNFGKLLLAWYDANARDLPWRKDHDPYRVWVSEIMLQQTRVAAAIEHYHEFLRRFPNLEKLASAREASVLAAWSGLGYYRRARMLHAAAKVVVRELGGRFPETAEGWRELPGIGRYTAAAIASITFGERVAVVDGNVERVLRRISGENLAGEALWDAAGTLLDHARPGDFNQAMMELGATVCTPRAPSCLMCPIQALCATRGDLPAMAGPKRQHKREIHYALHTRTNGAGRLAFVIQRPRDSSLMAGLWELPEIQRPPSGARPILTVRHSITITDYSVNVWEIPAQGDVAGKWVALALPSRLALTGLTRKIFRKLSERTVVTA